MILIPEWKDVDAGKFWFDKILSASRYLTTLWVYNLEDNYTNLCFIEADLSHLSLPARNKTSGVGSFYRLDHELVIMFRLAEMKVYVVYNDKVSF